MNDVEVDISTNQELSEKIDQARWELQNGQCVTLSIKSICCRHLILLKNKVLFPSSNILLSFFFVESGLFRNFVFREGIYYN